MSKGKGIDVKRLPVSQKLILKGMIIWVSAFIAVMAVFFAVALSEKKIGWAHLSVLLSGAFSTAAVAFFYHQWSLEASSYELRGSALFVRKGLVFPIGLSIPLQSVERVFIDRGPLDIVLGLYSLKLQIATPGREEGKRHGRTPMVRSLREAYRSAKWKVLGELEEKVAVIEGLDKDGAEVMYDMFSSKIGGDGASVAPVLIDVAKMPLLGSKRFMQMLNPLFSPESIAFGPMHTSPSVKLGGHLLKLSIPLIAAGMIMGGSVSGLGLFALVLGALLNIFHSRIDDELSVCTTYLNDKDQLLLGIVIALFFCLLALLFA